MKRVTFLALFICMFVFASLSQAGTWEYDFTDVKGDDWEKDWEVIEGEFGIEDGALKQTFASADDNNAFRAIAMTKWEITDGTIEAKMMHSGAGLNDALVFYRMSDTDNGYASRLQLDGYITIGRITEGTHAHILYTATPIEAEVWYIVKIELDGDSITVYVDDVEFVNINDDASLKGSVGFGMSRCSGGASLQWIRVTGDGVKPNAVSSNDKLATTWSEVKTSR